MKTKNLNNNERSRITQLLLEQSNEGKPKYGAMSAVAKQFGVCRKTITDIWNTTKKQHTSGQAINVKSKLKGRSMVTRHKFDNDKLESIDLSKRTTQQELSEGLGVSQSTVCRWVATDLIDSHTNAVKPGLTENNKLARLMYCLSHLQYDKNTKRFVFKDQSNVIHMDEKWFFITKPSQRFYVGKKEKRPHRTVQSKRFIQKVMFMCAVARPKYGPNKEVISDGKMDFRRAATEDGWKIELTHQPPNSPDLNVLDLGFFRAIQSLQQKKKSRILKDLVDNTMKAYEELEVIKLNYVFITLQACMLDIMKRKGCNDYPVPHMHKSKLAAAGLLPEYLNADIELVKECVRYVQNVGDASSISELVEALSTMDNNSEVTEQGSCSNNPTTDSETVGNITQSMSLLSDPDECGRSFY
ncbi:uncharacterized protein LOC141600811 [Silene latifolia]|uniref:uncharacterized protein LOC141600811 n=1 Tax=Silene latifolia TaxID=37657 RepID=UPI003D78365E